MALSAVIACGAAAAPFGCAEPSPADEEHEDVAAAAEAIGITSSTNLALYKPTSQSSTYTGSPASSAVSALAVDGNADGNFQAGSVTHTNSEAQAWWQVDLERVQPIGNVVIYNRTDCCSERLTNFNLLVSDDGASWQTYPNSDPAPAQITMAVNRTARYVRVQLVGTNVLSLAEVQVFPLHKAVPTEMQIESSHKCVDVQGGATALGTPLIQWDCHSGPNQAFQVFPVGSGVSIRATASGKCLTVQDVSVNNGAPIVLWDCNGGGNQIFTKVPFEDGSYSLRALHSNRCVDVTGGVATSGATLIQWDCHDGLNQRFRLPEIRQLVYGQTYTLQNRQAGSYLDTRGGGCNGNALCVSGASTPTRDGASGIWRLESAQGKRSGELVLPGERVYLKNLYGGAGGYLDTRGTGCQFDRYCVSTHESFDLDSGSGSWVVEAIDNAPSSPLWVSQPLRLKNLHGGDGGYLKAQSGSCSGNPYCVATGSGASAEAAWQLTPVSAPLFYGKTYHIRSNGPNGTGTYLDTREAGCQGNAYCVSTALTPDRAGTTATWQILSPGNSIPAGTIVHQGDSIVLKNLYNGGTYLKLGYDGSTPRLSTSWTDAAQWVLAPGGQGNALERQGMYIRDNSASNAGRITISGAGCNGNAYCVTANASSTDTWQFEALADEPTPDLVKRFAPQLRFDGASYDYPTSAETFYRTDIGRGVSSRNYDYSTLDRNLVPTYYQMIQCGSQVRIKYWFYYGAQDQCMDGAAGSESSHRSDWEAIMVTTNGDQSQIAAVTYWVHGDHFTRLRARGGVEIHDWTHPVVYVGKIQHGSYPTDDPHDQMGGCGFRYDYHHYSNGKLMNTWGNLVSLDDFAEPWMVYDSTGSGLDWGIGTHPSKEPPLCNENACDWGSLWGSEGAMGFTQCLAGDTDMGTYCRDGSHTYGYDYDIPTTDDGL
ncbi:Endo-1,4-beta-xylanase [Minicystis rosea]|nr:Endo-1,4-beta-xylanase [Minicystis rosea]